MNPSQKFWRKYLSAFPNAIELVSGVPRRKSPKSTPAAAPVNVNVPRASCCERIFHFCRRKSAPNVRLCRPWLQKLLYERVFVSFRLFEYCPSDNDEMPPANARVGGPKFTDSWLLPVIPALPDTLMPFAK